MHILEAVTSILLEIGVTRGSIVPAASLRRNLELDDTEAAYLVLEIRRRLGVDVTLDPTRDLSVADVCAMVHVAAFAAE